MGTSGARRGYKIFSINTTIRNPKRNYEFLETFKKYDGQIMDDTNLYRYFFDLVKKGIYQFNHLPQTVKDKIESGQELSKEEVHQAISDNPQATGLNGRVMTQLRALKDLSLVSFESDDSKSSDRIITISQLGNELLNNPKDATNVYTKIMLGLHANNPCRSKLLNKSCPFLNTLFVINEVNKRWQQLGNTPKGILLHEFAAFVLSMKDCDYKKAAEEIIKYRTKYKYGANSSYITTYLKNYDILPLAWKSITTDYPDEVFRKFEMTGLLIKHGKFSHTYIDFSNYNKSKVTAILENYKHYSFTKFNTPEEYYSFQSNLKLPWEISTTIKEQIVKAKAAALKTTLDPNLPLKKQEEELDKKFFCKALQKAVDKYDEKTILTELLILSGTHKGKSQFQDISEPLRLEYLLALAMGKKYGTEGLVSNIIYNEDGLPLHCATGGKCDIVYTSDEGCYILEPTMQRGRDALLNSETTNIVRHMQEEEKKTGYSYRVAMIAPYVHRDIICFFRYMQDTKGAKILSLNIDWITHLFHSSKNILELNKNYDKLLEQSRAQEDKEEKNNPIVDFINSFKCELNIVEQ